MKKARWLFVLLLAFALVAAACSSDDSDDTTTTAADSGGDTTETTAAGDTTETTAAGDTTETTAEEEMVDLSGTKVSVFGAPTGDEAVAFDNTFVKWNEATGGEAVYEGSDSLETQLPIRVDGGNPPDIAMLPQPGIDLRLCRCVVVALEEMGY